ncbi:hypothetical protein F7725_015687 [Dissostichus mawsoni]|uniref:Complexin-4 n=1 Tax=Dissostichus mawsoni TaxID=36200 RepID=A0A7J5YIL5_DISMA|nr:hypothetical protein F7725_015687 [Dissostichus mawsoni]
MAFLIKSMIGNPLSGIGLGGGGDKEEEAAPTDPAKAAGMTREEYEEYQKQVVEEKMERDADFLNKKAERATLRVCLRDKYRLPKSEQDDNMIEMAGDDVDVPEELLKMEEGKDSLMGQFQNLQNMDMDQLKEKASATVTEMKTKAEEKCSVM